MEALGSGSLEGSLGGSPGVDPWGSPGAGEHWRSQRRGVTCEPSENAVGYELLFGPGPYRVMDYIVVSDTHAPPVETVQSIPFPVTWWTIRVRDAFGSTIYADPIPGGIRGIRDKGSVLAFKHPLD